MKLISYYIDSKSKLEVQCCANLKANIIYCQHFENCEIF